MIISFSGIDGSGKTTYARQLSERLAESGYRSEYCKPDYTVNEIMKRFCAEQYGDPFSYIPNINGSIYIYGILIDWMDTLNRKLRDHSNCILVLDRYVYDILAQGLHYEAAIEPMIDMTAHFPHPDVSYFVQIEPEAAHNRLQQREDPPMHHLESLPNLRILHQCYQDIFARITWKRTPISAGTPIDQLFQDLLTHHPAELAKYRTDVSAKKRLFSD